MTVSQGLSIRLRQEAPIPLDVALDCAPGELVALVGPSGSGKSTTLRSIAGLYHPANALVLVDGVAWADSSRKVCLPARQRRVGLVFQSYALFPHMTARENVEAALGHVERERRSECARRLLARVNLEGLGERKSDRLSGGQRQRVALARALARDPAVLLLDEPFSAVDQATRERLKRELVALRRTMAMPIVLVTHDLGEAMALADRLVVLHHGRTLASGTPDEMRLRPLSPAVARLMGETNVFEGTVLLPARAGSPGRVLAGGVELDVETTGPFAAGTAVAVLIPGEYVVLHRRGRPSAGERENPVSGVVETLLPLGEQISVGVRFGGPGDGLLNFRLPTHAARRNGLMPGAGITISVLAEGVHLMPADTTGPA
jgi:molybdate transport system ATP-binding protein